MSIKFPQPTLFTHINTRTDRIFYIPQSAIPYYDMTFCIEGRMEYEFDGETVILESGDAFIFPPGSVRVRNETYIHSYYTCFNVMFDFEFDTPTRGVFRKCINQDTVYILETINRLMKSASPMKVEKSFDLFLFLYHQIVETEIDVDVPYVKAVKQYVEDNISKSFTIDDIASCLHLTPNYLCNLFKKETGDTVFGYAVSRRIELAKMLIVTEHQSLGEIAEMCGFRDYNYFSHTFKRLEGMTPSAYRKQTMKISDK